MFGKISSLWSSPEPYDPTDPKMNPLNPQGLKPMKSALMHPHIGKGSALLRRCIHQTICDALHIEPRLEVAVQRRYGLLPPVVDLERSGDIGSSGYMYLYGYNVLRRNNERFSVACRGSRALGWYWKF
ncbi:hypothetical protein C0995_014559 [Termitomyces sp. Mi166|nr:hypothetical protein C0995_014559 [Termitomyces sp. Mi166\